MVSAGLFCINLERNQQDCAGVLRVEFTAASVAHLVINQLLELR